MNDLIAALERLAARMAIVTPQDVQDHEAICAQIKTLREATRTGDRAVVIGWSTAVEARGAMRARWNDGHYHKMMADDRSFAAFALSELNRVVDAPPAG